jgi:hypothetical protein
MPAPVAKKPATPTPRLLLKPFRCPECGISLKARPELAGRKVKCSKCGKAVVVPAADPSASV